MLAKNLYRPIFQPDMTDAQVARLAKVMVVVITVIALYFAITSAASIVSLLLLGYAGVTQFFPGVVLGLYSRRVTTAGVFAGLAVGVLTAAVLILSKRDPFHGLNAGFIGLCVNFAITAVVSLVTPVRASGFDQPVQSAAEV
ncbi:MAG: hypothetical protein LAN70_16835 [Acidobacteriia bacterium]|nr:hypothetical protein [Terriglobia bacterium]